MKFWLEFIQQLPINNLTQIDNSSQINFSSQSNFNHENNLTKTITEIPLNTTPIMGQVNVALGSLTFVAALIGDSVCLTVAAIWG